MTDPSSGNRGLLGDDDALSDSQWDESEQLAKEVTSKYKWIRSDYSTRGEVVEYAIAFRMRDFARKVLVAERNRVLEILREFAKNYPTDIFTPPDPHKHPPNGYNAPDQYSAAMARHVIAVLEKKIQEGG